MTGKEEKTAKVAVSNCGPRVEERETSGRVIFCGDFELLII